MAKRIKLTELKLWLSVADAARHLAHELDREVTEADIFQHARTRRLTLSSRFPNPVLATQLTEEIWQQIAGGDRDFDLTDALLPFELPDGIYDLTMIGLERFDVEHEYQTRTGGPEVTAPPMARPTDGPFVKSCANGSVFSLYCVPSPFQLLGRTTQPNSSGRYMPPSTVFVVRPAALEEFVSGMQTVVSGNPVGL